MPICPRHSKEMIRVQSAGLELVGSGWSTHQAYYEDWKCPECQFRLRQYYRVINAGGDRDELKVSEDSVSSTG